MHSFPAITAGQLMVSNYERLLVHSQLFFSALTSHDRCWTATTLGSQIFGGIISCQLNFHYMLWMKQDGEDCCEIAMQRQRSRTPFVILRPFPSLNLLAQYRAARASIASTAISSLQWDILGRISLAFLQSPFTWHFWTVTYAEQGRHALHPPPSGSWPFWFNKQAKPCPLSWARLTRIFGPGRAHDVLLCPVCPVVGRESCQYYPPNYPSPEEILETSGLDWL